MPKYNYSTNEPKVVLMLPLHVTKHNKTTSSKCTAPPSYYVNDTQFHYIKASLIDDDIELRLATIMNQEMFVLDD